MTKSLAHLLACLLPLFGLGVSGQQGLAQAGDRASVAIQAFAAASTANALDELRREFTRQSGIDVRTSFASSATLAQQIAHGAGADVFVSADPKWARFLDERGLVARQKNLLGNRLVIVVPADSTVNVTEARDLLSAKIEHVAMGEPEGVPAGKYGRQALTKLGLWERVKPKVVAAPDVRRALAFVETGAAEAGIVYATDAAISRKVKVAAAIPPELSGSIVYPIVLLKQGEARPAARRFYEHLQSPAAAAVFRKYGFVVLDAADRGKKK